MAMGSFNSGGGQMPMAEINMTPLVDVMLVLLIIFIITAPLLTHSVNVELPKTASAPAPQTLTALQVSIDAANQVQFGGVAVAGEEIERRFREAVQRDEAVEVHLMADRATRYETVAEVMSAARRAGVNKIGFVTQPPAGGN
ncbi:ExbD/TolR family protein [Propionivibrio limicola]|uniref:ExbD/TolR family protein n=1 Tax=Propionivibrio limicola TaxID=167645 RepID=UPI0012921685|nr:biopolymer transporter ExbD [Propionivibrio limicola]